jgi:signal transduction histidine kinase
VRDTGTGIAAEHLPKVTDPFFTTKPLSVGSGLGLAQVNGFAQQSDGSLSIASTVGEGTTVTLVLPRCGDRV